MGNFLQLPRLLYAGLYRPLRWCRLDFIGLNSPWHCTLRTHEREPFLKLCPRLVAEIKTVPVLLLAWVDLHRLRLHPLLVLVSLWCDECCLIWQKLNLYILKSFLLVLKIILYPYFRLTKPKHLQRVILGCSENKATYVKLHVTLRPYTTQRWITWKIVFWTNV